MKKEKIVFLILHYRTIEDTMNCVQSIEDTINYENYDIVIVDNGSNNGTGLKLEKKYMSKDNIHVLLSNENLGFAKGNNIGFKYSKEKLKADFIIMINSDVLMLQKDFCDKILKEYNINKFAVLGPKIFMRDDSVCKYIDTMPSKKYFLKERKSKKIFYIFNKMHIRQLYSLIIKIKKIFNRDILPNTDIKKIDVVLNGCCLIFSKQYLDRFDGIDDRTFLYYEEILLYLRIKDNDLISIYNPELMIKHNENSSTKKSITKKREFFDFVLKSEIKSLDILIEELEK